MTKEKTSALAQNISAQDDATLAAKIIDAIREVDAATATRKEKALAAGKLLIEAQKRHPTEKAFERFLQVAGSVGIRRARDLIALAQGRKDFEQHKVDNAAAQQRHRDKLKAEKIEREKARATLPKPEPEGKEKPALRNADETPLPPAEPDPSIQPEETPPPDGRLSSDEDWPSPEEEAEHEERSEMFRELSVIIQDSWEWSEVIESLGPERFRLVISTLQAAYDAHCNKEAA